MHTFYPSTQEKQVDFCESETTVAHMMSSRTAGVTVLGICLKTIATTPEMKYLIVTNISYSYLV